MTGLVAAVPAAAVMQALSSCTRPSAPGPSDEKPAQRTGESVAERYRTSVLPALVAANPEKSRGGHAARQEHPAPAAAGPGRPPRQPAGACPLRQQQAAQAQAPLSAQLLARLPRAPAAALLERHPLLPRLCSILDGWAPLSRELGIPPQLHLPPPVIVEAAAWLLQLSTRSQAVLAGRTQELCLVVAAAASANQQLHEQLAQTMLLLKGVEGLAVAQGPRHAQPQPHNSGTACQDEQRCAAAAVAASASTPLVPASCLREIRTQLRARCWEHLQVQQPAVAERLLSRLAARHAQQQRQAAQRAQQACYPAQRQAFEADAACAGASVPTAKRAQPLEPASSSSDEPSASTASTASLEQQPQREQQEHESPASPGPATSAATERAALTPLELRLLQLLRTDASVAARLEGFLLADQAAIKAGPGAASAGVMRKKRKTTSSQLPG